MISRHSVTYVAVGALTAALLLSCSHDPNKEKHAYFDSGTRYFQQEKFREASIQFQNAIKVDPAYADAHYQLAQCYMKLKIWNQAFAELLRTVDLAPKNYKARIDLGNIQ